MFSNLFSLGNGGTETRVLNVDNATFTFPSSPLLTQGNDVSPGMLCSGGDSNDGDSSSNESNEIASRRRCRSDGVSSSVCECVHVRRVPLGATVEIILLDQGNQSHPSVIETPARVPALGRLESLPFTIGDRCKLFFIQMDGKFLKKCEIGKFA